MSFKAGVQMIPKVDAPDLPHFSPHRPPKVVQTHSPPTLSIYDFLFTNQPWRRLALCISADPDLFFPDQGVPNRQARAICESCPVNLDCLQHAIDNGERFGLWGGLTAEERGDVVYLMRTQGMGLEAAAVQIRGMKRKVRRRLRMTLFKEVETEAPRKIVTVKDNQLVVKNPT